MTTEIDIPIDLNRIYTAEEYAQLEDDGNRYELIDGKLIMCPATVDEHGRISDVLLIELAAFLKTNKNIGRVWSHTGFYIGKKPNGRDNVPEPDLGFIVASRVPPRGDKYLPYPDLVVEVWSRGSDLADNNKLKKARAKLQMFLNAGTSIAWGINPITQTVEVYHQGQTGPTQELGGDDELDGETIIPGFTLKVSSLFE